MAFDTNTGNMFKEEGYTRSRLDDLVRRMQSSDPFAEFQTTNSFSNSMAFNAEAEKEPDPVYPTDMMPGAVQPNLTLHHVAVLDVNKAVKETPPDPGAIREEHDKAVDSYIEADRDIKAAFVEELKNVDPEVGAGMERALGAPGGASAFTDTMKLADPGVSDFYSAINSLIGRNPNDQRVHAAIDKTLSNLHAHTDQQNELAAKGKGPPPAIDWKKLETPKQAMEFLARDVTKDPFMQEAADNEKIVQVMEKNYEDFTKIHLQGKQTHVGLDTLDSAKNNASHLMAVTGGNNLKADFVKVGIVSEQEQEAVVKTAGELKQNVAAVLDLRGAKFSKSDINSESIQQVAKAIHPENKPSPVNDPQFRIAMNGMG